MASKFGSWWKKNQQKLRRYPARSVVIIGVTIVGFMLIIVILGGYWFNWTWTGFAGKTLWDWLGLLSALAIPIVVGFGAAWFSVQQGKVSNAENKDNQRETALQVYIDKMSELLLHEQLRDSTEQDEVRKIARVRTLTILPQLDAYRKRSVLQFLYESGLIEKGKSIVNLAESDLREIDLARVGLLRANLYKANLSRTNLNGANLDGAYLNGVNLNSASMQRTYLHEVDLSEANLANANLRGAILHGTNLQRADLRGADLREADINKANLREADVTMDQLGKAKSLQSVIMPDGSIHP